MSKKKAAAAGEHAETAETPPDQPKRARQRPASRKAAAPAGAHGKLRVKQVRSGIGHAATYRRTLTALGLRHHQHEVVVADTPSTRGMLFKVSHLVRVRPEEA